MRIVSKSVFRRLPRAAKKALSSAAKKLSRGRGRRKLYKISRRGPVRLVRRGKSRRASMARAIRGSSGRGGYSSDLKHSNDVARWKLDMFEQRTPYESNYGMDNARDYGF